MHSVTNNSVLFYAIFHQVTPYAPRVTVLTLQDSLQNKLLVIAIYYQYHKDYYYFTHKL